MMLELNPTGETKRPNCTRKGVTTRTSRYLMFSAAIHKAGPMLTRKARRMKAGRIRICHPGANRYQAIMPTRMRKAIRKSTKETTSVAVGTINLGKYTLLSKFALAIKLFDASLRPDEKNVQGSIPANTISGYGAAPSEGKFAIRPKMTVKMIIIKSGLISAHAPPITVCL